MRKISVVIPTFDRKDVVLDAVRSVLCQPKGLFNFEVIVVDDASTDGTAAMFDKLDSKQVKFFRLDVNCGVNCARQFGVEQTTGDFVILLDSDDSLSYSAFRTFKKYESNFMDVNFFGVKAKGGELMSHFDSNGCFYDYEDWLGDRVGGELLGLYSKKVFDVASMDQGLFAFELFWVNLVVRHFEGCMGFPNVCRLYSFEQKNRLSNQLYFNFKQRGRDYERFLNIFSTDYFDHGLYKKLFVFCWKGRIFRFLGWLLG